MLKQYRIIDLSSGGCMFCGRILADLGADVIKMEKPSGDASRNTAPYYHNIPDPDKSLYWFAYNLGKRGVTLDLTTADGREIFRKMVAKTDCIIESFKPGFLDSLGLSYTDLSQINPGIILTSITPYGQTGPYASYNASDITLVGMGGLSYITGYPNGEPLRATVAQSELIAGSQAAAATMIALFHRGVTGEGQHVDVSIQASVSWTITNVIPFWELNHANLKRQGSVISRRAGGVVQKIIWQCKDGFVNYNLMGGKYGAKDNEAMVKWLNETGMTDDFILSFDWPNYNIAASNQQLQDKLESYIGRFFLGSTKKELYDGGLLRGVKVYPVNAPHDVVDDSQLKARDFWTTVHHPELNDNVVYPGTFFKSAETAFKPSRPAPTMGEHNLEVYREVGLSESELLKLKQSRVI